MPFLLCNKSNLLFLLFSVCQRLRRPTPAMCHISNNSITLLHHPFITPGDGEAFRYCLQWRIDCFIIPISGHTAIQIGKYKDQANMRMLPLQFTQDSCTQTVKSTIATQIKLIRTLVNQRPTDCMHPLLNSITII